MSTRAQTAQHKKAFLTHFRVMGNISRAASVAGVERRRVYEWQEHDEAFALAFKQAEIESLEALEAEAFRRAHDGLKRLKFDHRGRPLMDPVTNDYYTELEYSDTLLMFLMKARAPEKYRDRLDLRHVGPVQTIADLVAAAKDDARSDPD